MSNLLLDNMKKQEEAELARSDREKKRAANKDKKAEQAAVEAQQQRRSTRGGTGLKQEDPMDDDEKPAKNRAPLAKENSKKGKGNIRDFFKKEDLEAQVGGKTTMAEALEAEAEEKQAQLGVQDLRSERQPALVTGGVMRGYQLEGLHWMSTLYWNGMNGILADEMGLGKTIQTISLFAFIKERGSNGPFLVAAPLSTLSNWIDEFAHWTPSIPTLLYHGSKDEREELRRTRMKGTGKEEGFPIVCTSYEMCMKDRTHLSRYNWQYMVIVSIYVSYYAHLS